MRPHDEGEAGCAQGDSYPAQPGGRGECKALETAAVKSNVQAERDEQEKEQVCDDVCPRALALASSAISPNSLIRSPDAK
jgi:hypothetical protein